jgi:uncharacterized protein YndB with AHSA1/START domain
MKATLLNDSTLRFERLLPGPVERVWTYLTDSEKRATWFAGGEFDLRTGGRIELHFAHENLSADKVPPERYKGAEHRRFEGRITRLEPLRALAYTWKWGDEESEVLFELAPKGKDVLLTIQHRLPGPREQKVSVASGWDVHTGILADVLNGVEPRPFWKTHGKLEKEYEATL